MKYYSLNGQSPKVDFKQATILGQAPDGGLYFPDRIPHVGHELIERIEQYSNEDIAFRVIRPYLGDTIPPETLFQIVSETVNFPIPLVTINENISVLELFHGPTLAFKDIGARFMSRCLQYFMKEGSRRITVLVATSGDTGGAVADGFYDIEGVDVVILFPSGKVSPVQEKQLTTYGKNIHALEVMGTFDDCQHLVKKAFGDPDIRQKIFLTSANSINIARWLPQQFYYFLAWKQWPDKKMPPVISVPSGNFGNICAGILAMRSGLPVQHFIAACNANDMVIDYLATGEFIPKTAIATLSNAMDVGHPNNFVRILEIIHNNFPALKNILSGYSISDEETLSTIKGVFEKYGYMLDPHGAVGFLSLRRYLDENPLQKGIFLETAHPVKFPAAVESSTGQTVGIPERLQSVMEKKNRQICVGPEYRELKDFLMENFGD